MHMVMINFLFYQVDRWKEKLMSLKFSSNVVFFRSVQETPLLNVLIEKSPTFLISCVCYIDELSKVRASEFLKNSHHLKAIVSFLQVIRQHEYWIYMNDKLTWNVEINLSFTKFSNSSINLMHILSDLVKCAPKWPNMCSHLHCIPTRLLLKFNP